MAGAWSVAVVRSATVPLACGGTAIHVVASSWSSVQAQYNHDFSTGTKKKIVDIRRDEQRSVWDAYLLGSISADSVFQSLDLNKSGTITIEEINYKPGKFLNASLDKASEENERNYYKVRCNKTNEEIILVQIAGLVARRIVCEVEQGQTLKQGERIGMIRFGSRVDIFFKNKKLLAKLGQNVVAGESLIASL